MAKQRKGKKPHRPPPPTPRSAAPAATPRERALRLLEAGDLRGAIPVLTGWRRSEPGPEADELLLRAYRDLAAGLAGGSQDAELTEVLQRAVDTFPHAADLYGPLVAAFVRLRRFERAATLLKRQAALRPLGRQARHDHALLLLAAGHPAEALELVPDEGAEQLDGHVLRALAELRRGRPGVASGHLLEARRLGGGGSMLQLLEALVIEQLGRAEEAHRLLAAPGVAELGDARALTLLGKHHRASGDEKAAEALWLRALEQAEPGSGLAAELAPLRRRRLLQGAPESDEERLALYRAEPALDPAGSLQRRVRLRLAVARLHAGQPAAALPELEALARDESSGPLAPHVLQTLALCHERLEQRAPAIQSWRRLLELLHRRHEADPFTRAALHGRIAELRLAEEKPAAAAAELRSLLEHAPAPRKLVLAVVDALHSTGNCASCMSLLELALGRDTEDVELATAAATFAERHDWDDRAGRWWDHVFERDPRNPDARRHKLAGLRSLLAAPSRLRGRKAELDKGRRLIEQMLSAAPADPDVLSVAGQISWALGDHERSMRELEEALWLIADKDEGEALAKALGQLEKRIGDPTALLVSKLAQRSQSDPVRLANVALALANHGDEDEARPLFERSLELDPAPLEERHVKLVHRLFEYDHLDLGRDLARRGLELVPNSPRLLFLLALCLEELDETAEARKLDSKAARLARQRKDKAALELIERMGRFGQRTYTTHDEDFDDEDFDDEDFDDEDEIDGGLPLPGLDEILQFLGETRRSGRSRRPTLAQTMLDRLASMAGDEDEGFFVPDEPPPHPALLPRRKKKRGRR
jgi:tetratricopeptide (TPR) repeat protein